MASQLDELMVGREQPAKTKIALSGCPNSCAKPQINDIGLHGVIIPNESKGYTVYVGGKIGKKPMLGNKILTIIPEQQAASYIEAILGVYNRLACKSERIGDVINRVGFASFREEILQEAAKEKC